ncbi:MAG: translocation/assembly module TamB domain-containing protein [Candidatus Marinimicrobia bacterium]|nr:translocation/assembly module TamB domain-containing protein [Candidatus Neomarinimicrobiota bacterium]
MQRIFNLLKWFGRLLFAGVMILIIAIVIFLNKPSLFINDIEKITSEIINKNLDSNIKINISSIDGDFVSGFYAKNSQVYLNKDIVASIDSVYINPNISDLLFRHISFSNISLINPRIYHHNFSQINLEDNDKRNFNLDIPSPIPFDIIIDQFFIDNGIYQLDGMEYLFNGKLNCSYTELLKIDIESLNILSNESKIFNINEGNLLLSEEKFTLNLSDFDILKNNGETTFSYDRANNKISKADFLFKHLNYQDFGTIKNISLKLSESTSSEVSLNSFLQYNSYQLASIISLNLNKLSDGFLLAHVISLPQSDAQYELSATISSQNDPEINLQINNISYNSVVVNDLRLRCKLKDNLDGICQVHSLANITSPSIKVTHLSGIVEVDDSNYFVKDAVFESNVGNIEIVYGQYSPELQKLNCNVDIVNVNKFTKLFNNLPKIDGNSIQAKLNYYADQDSSSTQLNIQSNLLKIDDFSINGCQINFIELNKNIEYNADFYFPEFSEFRLDSLHLGGSGENNSYNNNIRGYNNTTGENIESSFTYVKDSSISIDYINGKLKDVPFHSDVIKFTKKDGVITSSPMTVSFGLGTIYSQIKFLNSENCLLNLRASEIDLVELKKIFQFQDRIKGEMNGEIYLSYENSQQLLLTNLNFRDGNFDDILFDNFDIQASFRENRLTLSEVDIDTDIGQLKFSGWLTKTGDKFMFRESDSLNISGNFDKFELSYLMRYFPWEQITTGLLSGKIKIEGKASSPRIELESIIDNPSFDKINAKNISGNLIYKNERLYLKGMNLETESGKYTGTGSMPANLSFVKMVDLNIMEQPLDFIFTGKSNSIEFLIPYIDEVESIDGEFTMQLGLSGTLKNPIRGGQVSIQNARVELLKLDNSIESLSGVATISSNKLIIKKLSGSLLESEEDVDLITSVISAAKNMFNDDKEDEDDNNVIVNGTLDLTEFFNPNYTISIDGNDIYLNSTYGQFEGEGDTEIFISGKDTLEITGEFRPSPNNFKLFSFGDDYEIDMIHTSNKKLIKYDIHVPFQDGIIIDTDEINMLVDGDMNIISTNNEELAFSGRINIIDGTFNYNSNEFSQATGTLILDPSKSSPYAEINAQTQLIDENIDVTFIGFLDNPNLILESSSQQYSQSDILRLLTFKDNDVIEGTSTSGQIGELLANYMEKELEKNVSLYTELDEFKVNRSGSLISGLENSNINVYLGKRISSNLYLNTKINLNQSEKMNEYEVSYRLNRNMSIVARVDEDQYWHINYRYKYKY